MPNRRGFTLIELLVAISIIAILSIIGIIVYTQVTMNARDGRRKLDLQSIAQALEVYYQKNSSYPITDWVYSTSTEWVPGLVPNYINSLPQDPKGINENPTTGNLGYAYYGRSCGSLIEGQWYILVALLENSADPDRLAARQYKSCDGTVLNYNAQTYIITPK